VEPETIAHFEILERLGSGAMGVVYRARDTLLKREVALKLIRPELTEDGHTRGRFLRECQAAAAINHPGIATIYEAGATEQGQLFFASELISGESLRAKITRGPVPPEEVIEIGVQLGEALAAAHEKDIVHRDIKPANLMIQENGGLRILDFGLARLLNPDEDDRDGDSLETVTQTRVGVVVGTPAYMSPEQASGATVDARTDVFACGSVLYAAVSGKDAFLTGSVPETLRRIIIEDPQPLETIDPSIPAGLRGVIRKALAKNADERFASAADLAEALRAARDGGLPPPHLVRAPTRARPRWILGLGLGLAIGALIVAGTMTIWFSTRPTLAFGSQDKLLIATVENLTDDTAFDLALRTALAADLQQSSYAAVFDQNQVADTLRLMRLDPSTSIDEQLGRDVCRFAGVRALLLPRILSVGEAYELQAILVDPVSGRHVDRIRVTAKGREEVLLRGIDELASELRNRLGESLESIQEADYPVAQVTTSSWEALHYLALGNVKWSESKYRDAAAMYELALQKDPRFVSAKGSLGLLLIQFLGEPERGKQLLHEAFVEADGLPEREYLMIKAVHRQFVDEDLEGALEEYELISDIYPDLMQPYNNRGRIFSALGRYDEAVKMFERAAEVDPTSSFPQANLYWTHLWNLRRAVDAEKAARRLVELGPAISDYRSMMAWSLAAQARFDEALPELRRVLEDEPRHPYALPNTAHVLYVSGRADEAVQVYRQFLQLIVEDGFPGARYAATRDLALALADSGELEEAGELTAAELERLLAEAVEPDAGDLLALAQLEAAGGRTKRALEYIEQALARGIVDGNQRMLLAEAYALTGQHDRALDELRLALEQGYPDFFFPLVKAPLRPLHGDARFRSLFGIDPEP
jgi:tetratricopeptide (TPR) repeat protein/tRNA A-37 threonylcarbamoyl transferase component Bud32